MHASATGLAFLAACPPDFVDTYLRLELAPRTDNTITDPETLRATLDEIRERGYSINQEGLSTGITALGAAILDSQGTPVGALSVSGPSSRITPDKFAALGQAARDTADRVRTAL